MLSPQTAGITTEHTTSRLHRLRTRAWVDVGGGAALADHCICSRCIFLFPRVDTPPLNARAREGAGGESREKRFEITLEFLKRQKRGRDW